MHTHTTEELSGERTFLAAKSKRLYFCIFLHLKSNMHGLGYAAFKIMLNVGGQLDFFQVYFEGELRGIFSGKFQEDSRTC